MNPIYRRHDNYIKLLVAIFVGVVFLYVLTATAAKRLGFSEIYTSTDNASSLMSHRSWHAIDIVETLRGTATIFKKVL